MGTASSRTAARCDDLGTPFLCNGGGGTSGGTLASALNRISSERRCLARSGETTKYTKMPDEAHELQSAPPKLTLLRGCDPSNPAPFEVKNGQTYYSFGDTEELQDDRNSRRNQRCFPFSLVELFSGFTKRRDRDHHKHQRLNMHSYGPSGHGEQNGTGILTNGRIPKLELSSSCQSSGFSSYNSTPYSVVSNTHTSFVPPGYAESMKELADLKAQLNALSKLISTDDATLGPDKQSALFPDRGVQTESCHIASTSTEMQQAHEQIARLTRILHEKDIALRQTEQENSRLNELLRSVQTSVRHSGTSSNFSSSESREFHSSCSSSVLPKPQRRRTAMHVFPLDPRNQSCPMPPTDYCRREQVQQYAESREPSLDFTPGTAHHIPDLTTN